MALGLQHMSARTLFVPIFALIRHSRTPRPKSLLGFSGPVLQCINSQFYVHSVIYPAAGKRESSFWLQLYNLDWR